MAANDLPESTKETPAIPAAGAGEAAGAREAAPDGAPLHAKPGGVTRLKQWLIKLVTGLVLATMVAAFINGLVPKKKQSAGASAAQQPARGEASGNQRPNLPQQAASLKGQYGVANGKPGVAGMPQPVVQPQNNDQAADTVSPASPETAPMQGGHLSELLNRQTPEQHAAQTRQEQRRKDSESASRASVSFGGHDLRSQEIQPVREASANLPDLSGLNRVVDRLAGPIEADDQNRQGEKRGFVRENRDDFPYLKTTLLTPISKYEVKAGSIIPGVLLTGINSDLPGQITAQVRENVYDTVSGRYLLIPQGARLIGEYDSKLSYGQERVLIVWTRIVMPNGNSIGLEGMPGVDLSGYAGVGGSVNNHYGKLLTGVVLGSMIGAGAQVAVGGQGSPNVPPSFSQLFVSGAAGNINQAGQQITQKNLNLQSTIEIAPGQKINIFLTKDMILRPYIE